MSSRHMHRLKGTGIAHFVDCSFRVTLSSVSQMRARVKDVDSKTGRERITRRVLLGEMFNQDTFTKSLIIRYQILNVMAGNHDEKLYSLQVDFRQLDRKLGRVRVCMSRKQFERKDCAFPFVGLCQVTTKQWVPFYYDFLDDLKCTEIPWFMKGTRSLSLAIPKSPRSPEPKRPKLGGA